MLDVSFWPRGSRFVQLPLKRSLTKCDISFFGHLGLETRIFLLNPQLEKERLRVGFAGAQFFQWAPKPYLENEGFRRLADCGGNRSITIKALMGKEGVRLLPG